MKWSLQIWKRFLPFGLGVCLVAEWLDPPSSEAAFLDDVLMCLETNGVLTDRASAEAGGLRGILQSVDPEAEFRDARDSVPSGLVGDGACPVVQAVEFWPENLVYIKLSGLVHGSGAEVLAHLKSLSDRRGVLLDLRGARGEDLESACRLAALVRDENDPLFLVRGPPGTGVITNRVIGAFTRPPPLMVLIDEETRGASEALVSVLQGGGGVLLVGTATKGERNLRSWIVLPEGQSVRLSTRKWQSMTGNNKGKTGVEPDIVVNALESKVMGPRLSTVHQERGMSAKSDADQELLIRVDGDAALQRATDLLLGIHALGVYGQE